MKSEAICVGSVGAKAFQENFKLPAAMGKRGGLYQCGAQEQADNKNRYEGGSVLSAKVEYVTWSGQ